VKSVSTGLIFLIVLVIVWIFISNNEKEKRMNEVIKKLKNENNELKIAYFDLLSKYLSEIKNLPSEVLTELHKLKNDIDRLDADTHFELNETIKLVSEGKESKAIRELAKIVENKLKEKAIKDESFKKQPMFDNLLKYAKEKGMINTRQFENCDLLRKMRNMEVHEMAVQVDKCHFGIAVFTGIDILYSISKN